MPHPRSNGELGGGPPPPEQQWDIAARGGLTPPTQPDNRGWCRTSVMLLWKKLLRRMGEQLPYLQDLCQADYVEKPPDLNSLS